MRKAPAYTDTERKQAYRDKATTVERLKEVLNVYRPGSSHMVGDGFPVRNLFPSNDLDRDLDPFLMLDYAGPHYFPPTQRPRGVGEHPHRGFETVTIVYQGVVEHRDSAGNAGTIGPGDVQWMTAASGVVHEEMHGKAFARQGGTLQAIQLWVNLPKTVKLSPPRYQTLLNEEIPVVQLDNAAGSVRVIAGEIDGVKGPAKTFTPVHLYDLRLNGGHRAELTVPDGYNTALLVLSGRVRVNGLRTVREAELAVHSPNGTRIFLDVEEDTTILVMSGEPINEPVARYGPFVMNTEEELVQAFQDYRTGKMGHLEEP
jgi:redox-sensitive bicupin YhaK (pirin superfamily)